MNTISKRDLRRLAKGETPSTLESVPFAIVRSSIRVPGLSSVSWGWELAISPKEEDIIPINRETAVSIIEANGMTAVHKRPFGQIYELPGQPFLAAYGRKGKSMAS